MAEKYWESLLLHIGPREVRQRLNSFEISGRMPSKNEYLECTEEEYAEKFIPALRSRAIEHSERIPVKFFPVWGELELVEGIYTAIEHTYCGTPNPFLEYGDIRINDKGCRVLLSTGKIFWYKSPGEMTYLYRAME